MVPNDNWDEKAKKLIHGDDNSVNIKDSGSSSSGMSKDISNAFGTRTEFFEEIRKSFPAGREVGNKKNNNKNK